MRLSQGDGIPRFDRRPRPKRRCLPGVPLRLGEDIESGLRFLFNALQGIPEALYLDNGPIAKSGVFNTVMEHLGVCVLTYVPSATAAAHDAKGTGLRNF